MAATMTAAALVTETALAPGLSLPRVFTLEGRSYAIENGVARDMLKAGMIALESRPERPEDERFVVTQVGFRAIVSFLGRERLLDLGVLNPD